MILRLLEGTIDIIIRFPNPGHTGFIVPEALLEVSSQLREDDCISGLLINLGAQDKPSSLAQDSKSVRVFFVSTIEACRNPIMNNEVIKIVESLTFRLCKISSFGLVHGLPEGLEDLVPHIRRSLV